MPTPRENGLEAYLEYIREETFFERLEHQEESQEEELQRILQEIQREEEHQRRIQRYRLMFRRMLIENDDNLVMLNLMAYNYIDNWLEDHPVLTTEEEEEWRAMLDAYEEIEERMEEMQREEEEEEEYPELPSLEEIIEDFEFE